MVELGLLAFECRQQYGLHAFEDGYIYEVINPNTTEPLPVGEEGELVITHLERTGMPLIRYRTGDITRIDDSPCSCGRTNLRLKGIQGRYSQRLNVSGRTVDISQIEEILGKFQEYSGDFNVFINGSPSLDQLKLALAEEELFPDLVTTIREELAKILKIPIQITLVKKSDLFVFPHRSYKIIDRKKDPRPFEEIQAQLKAKILTERKKKSYNNHIDEIKEEYNFIVYEI